MPALPFVPRLRLCVLPTCVLCCLCRWRICPSCLPQLHLRLYNTQHRTPIHNTIRLPQCAHCRPPPAVVVARVLQVVPFSVSACRPPACRVLPFVGAPARPPSAAHLRAVLLLPLAPVPPLPNSTPCCASQHTAPDPYSPHNPMSALLPTCVPACRCGDACVAVCAPAPPPRCCPPACRCVVACIAIGTCAPSLPVSTPCWASTTHNTGPRFTSQPAHPQCAHFRPPPPAVGARVLVERGRENGGDSAEMVCVAASIRYSVVLLIGGLSLNERVECFHGVQDHALDELVYVTILPSTEAVNT
jgi:hypothetical protein